MTGYEHYIWLGRIRKAVKGLSYISHVRYPNKFAMKVIINGTELEFPLEGDPKFMIDENYEDFLNELKTYDDTKTGI